MRLSTTYGKVVSVTQLHFDDALVERALNHIEDMWGALTREQPTDYHTLIALPHPYVVPSSQLSDGFMFDELYYWDSYFIILALLASGRVELAKGIVENQLSLLQRFGLVPNASRFYLLGRSQPPMLTMQAFAVYEHTQDREWLKWALGLAEQEYHEVWLGTSHPHHRQVLDGLSRYYDTNVIHDLAECESGWDYTTRFHDRCLDFVPVDLNALLWRYETDFAAAAKLFDDAQGAVAWKERAAKRTAAIETYCWDGGRNFYFDYDFRNGRPGDIFSLAAYVPMFVGMISHERAAKLVDKLALFETRHGLTATQLADVVPPHKQWAAPNGWAPLHYFVVRGLERYGESDQAAAIARKWLHVNLERFDRTGYFYEKYNVIDPEAGVSDGVYPDQIGFGWTNAVFSLFAREYL